MDETEHVDRPTNDPSIQCRFPGCTMVAVSDGRCYGDGHEALREASEANHPDIVKLLVDIERSALFLGRGKQMRTRIAEALTELTGNPHVAEKKPSGAIRVVLASNS